MSNDPRTGANIAYDVALLVDAYEDLLDVHEQLGFEPAALLIFAAFVIEMHTHAAQVSTEETLDVVRRVLPTLRQQIGPILLTPMQPPAGPKPRRQ